MPRYTRMVGWLVRTTTLVLTVLVGGGPAIAVVCETIVHRMQRSITQEPRRRLTRTPPSGGSRGGPADGVDADHVDHQQTEAAAGDSRWSVFSRDCCREFAPPRYSLAASRVDANLLPASRRAALIRASLSTSDLQSDEPIHGLQWAICQPLASR